MKGPSELRRRLGAWDTIALFVGIVVGSGVFQAPADVAAASSGLLGALTLWVFGGIVTACGAFCYAECATRLPRTGGFFVFYRAVFGESVAFVGGWVALFVTYPASVAAIAVVFARYLGELVPALVGAELPVTIVVLVGSGLLNVIGVRIGTLTQRLLTSAKVLAIAGVCVAALFVTGGGAASRAAPAPQGIAWAVLLSALVSVLWAYDGWSDITLVAGELKDPARSYGKTILVGTAILVTLYATVQLAVARLLPHEQAAASTRIVSDAVAAGFGARAGWIVALLVVISALGSIHGIVLAVSRLAFAMARDGAFIRWFGHVHPRWETPARATWALVAGSVVYSLSTDFRGLVSYFTFSVWIFYALTAVALLVLRRRGVGDAIAWKAWGGSFPPIVLLVTAAAMTSSLLVHDAREALAGFAMIALGFALWWARRLAGISSDSPDGRAG